MAETENNPNNIQATNNSQPSDSYLNEFINQSQVQSLSTEEINNIKAIADVEDKRYKTRTVLTTFTEEEKNNRDLRKTYAKWILIGLLIEMLLGNIAFFCIGFGWFEVSEWVANIFFVGMYTQIAAITTIVVKNLFPVSSKDSGTQIKELIEKL